VSCLANLYSTYISLLFGITLKSANLQQFIIILFRATCLLSTHQFPVDIIPNTSTGFLRNTFQLNTLQYDKMSKDRSTQFVSMTTFYKDIRTLSENLNYYGKPGEDILRGKKTFELEPVRHVVGTDLDAQVTTSDFERDPVTMKLTKNGEEEFVFQRSRYITVSDKRNADNDKLLKYLFESLSEDSRTIVNTFPGIDTIRIEKDSFALFNAIRTSHQVTSKQGTSDALRNYIGCTQAPAQSFFEFLEKHERLGDVAMSKFEDPENPGTIKISDLRMQILLSAADKNKFEFEIKSLNSADASPSLDQVKRTFRQAAIEQDSGKMAHTPPANPTALAGPRKPAAEATGACPALACPYCWGLGNKNAAVTHSLAECNKRAGTSTGKNAKNTGKSALVAHSPEADAATVKAFEANEYRAATARLEEARLA